MSNEQNSTNKNTKTTILAAGVVIASIAAVAVSILSLGKAYDLRKDQVEMTTAEVPSLFQMIASGETAQTPESGSADYTTFDNAALHIVTNDGGEFAASKDSVILLKTQSGKQVGFPVSAFTSDDSETVLYTNNQSTANIGNFVVSVSDDEVTEESTTTFSNGALRIYTGSAPVGPCSITVAYETSDTFDESVIANILDSAGIVTGDYSVFLFEEPVNATWTDAFSFNDAVIAFSSGDENIYVSKFNGSLTGAGFDESVKLTDSISASYSDIKDEETGLSPFFVNSNGFTFKLLSASPETLQTMFQ